MHNNDDEVNAPLITRQQQIPWKILELEEI